MTGSALLQIGRGSLREAVGDDAFEELRRAANHPNGSALREAARSLALSRWPTQSARIHQL